MHPDEPPTPIEKLSKSELLDRARRIAERATMRDRGAVMSALNRAGLSWRKIERETGVPYVTAYRWARSWRDQQRPSSPSSSG